MFKNHVAALLTDNAGFDFTESQKNMVEKLADFIVSPPSDTLFMLRGFAGTGKTTMINQLTKTLDHLRIKSLLMAPTGRAAKVLAGYTGKPAFTIHKRIYRQKSGAGGFGVFLLDKNLSRHTWFIVDEASMISDEASESSQFGSGRLLEDLLEYVYGGEGCRLVLAGDTAQLPPVGSALSPALDESWFDRQGFRVISGELTDVVRQERESLVLANATRLRQRIFSTTDTGFFRINLSAGADLERISGGDLLDKLSGCYDKYGTGETMVLTRSNKRANLYNKGIRHSILYRDSVISRGDLLMVVKNNYFWIKEEQGADFIANGEIGEITHIYGYEELYGFKFADIALRLGDHGDQELDCKILLDTLEVEAASLTRDDLVRLYNAIAEDYPEIRNKQERWKKIRANPWFNALQVKFAYAVTCHKAQGGQWKAVFVDTGYLSEEQHDREFLRWLYTAFTRPTEKLFLVNFDKRFFGEG